MPLNWPPMAADEVISAAAWAVVGILAFSAVRRAPRARRGAWLLVGASCAIFVGDKVADFQTVFYEFARSVLHQVLPSDLRARNAGLVRYAVLVPLVIATVGILVWLARRWPGLGRPEVLGLAGVAGIAAYVGLRLLPPFAGAFDGFRGWLVEGPCALLVTLGALAARRPAEGRPGPEPPRSGASRA